MLACPSPRPHRDKQKEQPESPGLPVRSWEPAGRESHIGISHRTWFVGPLRFTEILVHSKKKWRCLLLWMFHPILLCPISCLSVLKSGCLKKWRKIILAQYFLLEIVTSFLLRFQKQEKQYLLFSQEVGKMIQRFLLFQSTPALPSPSHAYWLSLQSVWGRASKGDFWLLHWERHAEAVPILMWTNQWAEPINPLHINHATANRWQIIRLVATSDSTLTWTCQIQIKSFMLQYSCPAGLEILKVLLFFFF